MERKKRLVSRILVVAVFLTLLPGVVLAAGGEALRGALVKVLMPTALASETISAPPQSLSVPLLNAATMYDSNVRNTYVYKDNGELNGGGPFTLTDWNPGNMNTPPSTLSAGYNHKYARNNGDSTWRARYKWQFNESSDSAFLNLARNGQISYFFSAQLMRDSHIKLGKHAHVKLDDQGLVRMYSGSESNQFFELIADPDEPDETWLYQETGWRQLPTNLNKNLSFFFWHNQGDRCWDGDSGVYKAAIAFADSSAPYVTGVSLNGDRYYYNSGNITFTVYFNEPIRLADWAESIQTGDKTRVRLAAYRREDRQSVEAYAQLTEVGTNYLTFKYDVPSDNNTDMIITGLAAKDLQTSAILTANQELKVMAANKDKINVSSNGTPYKANATFTDLAGNGIDMSWTAVSFPQEIHVDTISPKYANTVIESGSMIRDQDMSKLEDGWNKKEPTDWSTDDIDRSQVFAGVGDWINLAVDFDEELRTFGNDQGGAANGTEDGKHFTATLNIKDGTGNNVTLKGLTIISVQDNVNNNKPRTRLRFETLTITENMKPDTANLGPIKIISLTVDGSDSATVYDMCGNTYTINSESYNDPDKQEWLDTVAPTVQVSEYTLEDNGICVPLQVFENTDESLGEYQIQFKSGTAGVGDNKGEKAQEGGRVLVIPEKRGAKFECVVTTSNETPGDDANWTKLTDQGGVTFTQMDSLSYLHIRMAEDSEVPIFGLKLEVTGYDYAGNAHTEEKTISGLESYDVIKEHTPPSASAEFTAELEDNGTKTVTANLTVSDLGELDEVWYKWEKHAYDADSYSGDTGKDPNVDEDAVTEESIKDVTKDNAFSKSWTKADSASGETSAVIPLTTEATARKNNFFYLCVYAIDSSGNEMRKVFSFRQDMRMPGYDLSIPEKVTETGGETIEIGLMDTEEAKDLGPVNVWHVQEGTWAWQYGVLFVTLHRDDLGSLTRMVDQLIDSKVGNEDRSKPSPMEPTRDTEIFEDIDDLLATLSEEYGEEVTSSVHSILTSKGWRHFNAGAIPNMITSGKETPELNYSNTVVNLFNYNDQFSGIKAEELQAKYTEKYYGNLDIYLTQAMDVRAGDKKVSYDLFQETTDANAKPVYVDKYTVKLRQDDGNTDANPINKAVFHAPIAANGQLLVTEDENTGFSEADLRIRKLNVDENFTLNHQFSVEPSAFKTLAGITVPFTVGNNRVAEWGVEDIDFENSSIEIWYSPDLWTKDQWGRDYTTDQWELVEKLTTELTPNSAEQAFVFPEDYEYESGVYKIVVNLVTKSFENTDTYDSYEPGDRTFIFRVFAAEPASDGGIYSVFIADHKTQYRSLYGKYRPGLSAQVQTGTFEEGKFTSTPLSEYTIPLIKKVFYNEPENEEDGEYLAYEAFTPAFTYQNEYINKQVKDLVNTDLIQLYVWIEDESGEAEKDAVLMSDATPFGLDEETAAKSYGFTFIVDGKDEYTWAYNGDQRLAHLRDIEEFPVTICMQEVYANGEKSSIRKITVSQPDYKNEAVEEFLTPNVDVTFRTGVASETVSIGVNDISSLNGIKSIHLAPGGIDDGGMFSTAEWTKNKFYEAELKSVEDEGTEDGEGGTYFSSLLSIGGVTKFGDPKETGGVENRASREFLEDLLVGPEEQNRNSDPVVIVMDNNYNVTIRQLSDVWLREVEDGDDVYYEAIRVDGLYTDWDPDAVSVSSAEDSTVKDGQYTQKVNITSKFIPASFDDVTLYISTVDPATEPGAGDDESSKDNEYVTDTIAIPVSELMVGTSFTTVYDGSTPNTAGVTGIEVTNAVKSSDEVNYVSDVSYGAVRDYLPDWQGEYTFEVLKEAWNVSLTVTGSQPAKEVYIYAVDELGRRSEVITIDAGTGGDQSGPKVIKDNIKRNDTDGSLELDFTQAVVLTDPEIPNDDGKLTTHKTGVPIYSDGQYTVKYIDIFGQEYEETITVALDDDNLSFTYSMTPGELTNQDVVFRLDGGEVNGAATTVTGVKVYGTDGSTELDGSKYTYKPDETNKSAEVTMTENGVIEVTLAYGGTTTTKRFPITNIDKVMEAVDVTWEYEDRNVYETDPETGEVVYDEETGQPKIKDGAVSTGLVTAVLHIKDLGSNEVLIGTEGELRYTFPNKSEKGATHIFKYMDAAGNTGTFTATLPVSIQLPIPQRLDGYKMKVSHTALTQAYDDISFQFVAGAKTGTGGDEKELTPPDFEAIFTDDANAVIQAKEIYINLSTEVDATIYVLNTGATEEDARAATTSAVIQGVTVAGKNVKVEKNAEFVIAVVEDPKYATEANGSGSEDADKSPQKVYLIPVKITNIPQLKDVQIAWEKKTNFEYWAYLDPMENKDEKGNYTLTVTNVKSEKDGVLYNEETKRWYHIFRAPGEFEFTYRDPVGHTGSITATCDQIPANAVLTEVTTRWWPYEEKDQTKLTKQKVNFDVTYQETFNMLIAEAGISNDGKEKMDTNEFSALNDTLEINVSLDSVTVTFKQNTTQNLWLWVTGETGSEAFIDLGQITIIDKTAPEVTTNKDETEGTPVRSTVLTFTPNENVTCSEVTQSSYFGPGNPMTVTAIANGEYTYTFTDEAGNSTTATIQVKNIDREAPTVVFADTSSGDGKSWEDFANGQNVEKLETVWVKASEDCSYTFQGGVKTELTKDTWRELKIDRVKGGFALALEDEAGNTALVTLTGIGLRDVTAPRLFLSPQSISIPQGMDTDERDAAIREGVTASDDISENDKITITCEDGNLRDSVGEYVIYFTAEDEQGNTSARLERYVRVYSATDILLRVKGADESEYRNTGYMNTAIMTSPEVTFEVSNLRGTNGKEPFTLYIRKGMKTAGQMKNNSTKAPAARQVGDTMVTSYTFDGSGYYTVYIVTQDRAEYLTYLYIEQ